MPTSFRIPPDKMSRLDALAKRLGKSKAKVVIEAIDKLYDAELSGETRSVWDELTQSGFTPLETDWGDLASNEAKQRQMIREKLSKKNRG